MARFDKKWLFIHIPAGVAVVCLLAFGVVQCDSKNDENAEKRRAQDELIDAGKKMDIAVGKIDSLLNVNRNLDADNVRKSDTIRVLKDSVNTLNGQVRELRADNDSLIVALDDCAKSKQRTQPRRRPSNSSTRPSGPVKRDTVYVPVKSGAGNDCCPGRQTRTANVTMDGSYNNGNVVVDNAPTQANVKLDNHSVNNGNIVIGGANTVVPVSAQQANVALQGARNNGNVIVENGAQNTGVSLNGNSVNNGAIVVGDANTVYHVVPDTVVRFVTKKNVVVKCEVVSRQRRYR